MKKVVFSVLLACLMLSVFPTGCLGKMKENIDTGLLFLEDFEQGMSRWNPLDGTRGPAELSTEQAMDGKYSLKTNGKNRDYVKAFFTDELKNVKVEIWFYDVEGSVVKSNIRQLARLDGVSNCMIGQLVGSGATVYTYRKPSTGSAVHTSSVTRSVGWHKIEVIVDSEKIIAYVDDTLLFEDSLEGASITGIVLGDPWGTQTDENIGYWDSIKVTTLE